jgi:AcrR family transcriptional regulator
MLFFGSRDLLMIDDGSGANISLAPRQDEHEDFRVRVAREKRERMRQRLLFAALDVFLVGEWLRPPAIDDIIQKAGVSRGTFYKYFDSLEELLAILGQQMAAETLSTYQRIFDPIADAATRVAGGPLLGLTRAAMQPRRVPFTSKVDFGGYLSRDDGMWHVVSNCLAAGKTSGDLSFSSLDAATDFVIGATIEATRRQICLQSFDKDYVFEVTRMIITGLGLDRPRAAQAVQKAWDQLEAHATTLPWWHR